ncbi:MAG: hypothetical protein WBI17_02230 [Clostridiaceae bacterium]
MELLKKLNFKTQTKIHLINPPDSFQKTKAEISKIMEVSENLEGDEPVLFVLAFFTKQSEIMEVIEALMGKVNKDSLIWLCYPKKSSKNYKSDITRDRGWEVMGEYSYEPVRQIAIDDDWSALRFRPLNDIKEFTRDHKMVLSEEGRNKAKTKK